MSKKRENDGVVNENVNERARGEVGEPVFDESANDEILKLEGELNEAKSGYLRLAADFDNYKKRNNALNAALRETVTADIIEEFIPLADNYELALKYLDEKSKVGVTMIYKQLIDVFSRFNVKEMEVLGQPFNPVYHDAVESVDAPGAEQGTVTDIMQKGYMFGDKVLRCAMVKVAK
ncbi:MAG: nucleotide exchange factor GrpE [Clostridiales bacterium]|jgi:molecular chaperone GrpE|nr:nucleotide exchange factor GrpE [Clostridiales bacterium]